MNVVDFSYKIQLKLNSLGDKIISLTQIPFPKGNEITIEIPESDLETVIAKLRGTTSILDEPIIPFNEQVAPEKVVLEQNIIQTLVALFLSGVSIGDLSKQYDYTEELIKFHLEDKGIIIFDEF